MKEIKHYEDVWVDAEIVADEKFADANVHSVYTDLRIKINELSNSEDDDDKLSAEQVADTFGHILFYLCFLSKKHNVNTYHALQQVMSDFKMDQMEDE